MIKTNPPRRSPFRLVIIGATLLALGAGGYYYATKNGAAAKQQDAAVQQAGGAMSALPVKVLEVQPRDIRLWNEFSGRLEAVERVKIQPRVSGTIQEILFTEGAVVQKGDPLFVIDPRLFEAEMATAQAAVASAKSLAELSRLELNRADKLQKKEFLSASQLDERRNSYHQGLAAIKAAEAQVKQAKLNLEYAHITAPVSGRVGRAEITVGNVVEAGANAPVLTTIVGHDTLYAEFDVDEQTYVTTVRKTGEGEEMPVEITLAGEAGGTYHGHIYSFDNQLNTQSGTIRARALIQNTDGALLPGMYADVRLGSAEPVQSLLLPERALGTDQSKRYVYIADASDKVAYREVKLGKTVNNQRVVLEGLEPGDRVILNNLQKIRADMPVSPQPIEVDDSGVIVGEAELAE